MTVVNAAVRTIVLTPESRDTLKPNIPTIRTATCHVDSQPSSRKYSVRVQDNTGGSVTPVVNDTVALSLIEVPQSGGHIHDAGRPSGSFVLGNSVVSKTVVTDASGTARFVYFPPRASGQYVVGATTQGANDASDSITVGFKRLMPLVQTLHDSLFGDTAIHPFNHFATSKLAQGISQLADSLFLITGHRLFVNDESLEAGGLFDINGDWTNPHCSHLSGVAADVRLRGLSQGDSLLITQVWKELMGDSTVVREGNPRHFHLKQLKP